MEGYLFLLLESILTDNRKEGERMKEAVYFNNLVLQSSFISSSVVYHTEWTNHPYVYKFRFGFITFGTWSANINSCFVALVKTGLHGTACLAGGLWPSLLLFPRYSDNYCWKAYKKQSSLTFLVRIRFNGGWWETQRASSSKVLSAPRKLAHLCRQHLGLPGIPGSVMLMWLCLVVFAVMRVHSKRHRRAPRQFHIQTFGRPIERQNHRHGWYERDP